MVPRVVSFNITVTPGIGSPALSPTVPLTVMDWAKLQIEKSNSGTIKLTTFSNRFFSILEFILDLFLISKNQKMQVSK
jgi:hypothetical protein